jgi:hypothetical protein
LYRALVEALRATYDWRYLIWEDAMNRASAVAVIVLVSFAIAASAEAGWGRTLHPVSPAPAVVTQHVVVPTTSYYAPATTTYYAPATTTYSIPATTYVAPAPVVVQRPAVTTPGYVIPPPRFRIRRDAPSLYVAPSVVVP